MPDVTHSRIEHYLSRVSEDSSSCNEKPQQLQQPYSTSEACLTAENTLQLRQRDETMEQQTHAVDRVIVVARYFCTEVSIHIVAQQLAQPS